MMFLEIYVLQVLNNRHKIFSESDKYMLIVNIIEFALSFHEKIYVTREFIIKSNFVNLKSKEGIERRADCAIYQEIRSNMIILTEIKKDVSDMEKCL